MSLSGLDSPEVTAAYQTVLENGGWFLLQYTARDAIDLLSQGIGGATEMRDQAVQYFEKNTGPTSTPLFGLVQARRKRVLVKIASPDSSRLIQARAQVHWGSISSVFADHDSECELSNAAELSESALAANTDLHSSKTATPSARKTPLSGIDEGAEEAAREAKSRPTTSGDTAKPEPSVIVPKVVEPEVKAQPVESITPTDLSHISSLLLKPGAEPSKEPKPKNYLYLNDDFPSESNRRLSSMSSKSKEFELFGSSLDFSFLDKPKVKLGPRPADNKRTASTRVSTDGRPSAALPAGLRSARPISQSRPISRDSTITVQPHRFPAPPPIPESPTIQIPRPKSSSGSVKSLPATLPRTNGTSKEKQRLMKFREMYKQQGKKPKTPNMPKTKTIAQADTANDKAGPVQTATENDHIPPIDLQEVKEEVVESKPTNPEPIVISTDEFVSEALPAETSTDVVAHKQEDSTSKDVTPSKVEEESGEEAKTSGASTMVVGTHSDSRSDTRPRAEPAVDETTTSEDKESDDPIEAVSGATEEDEPRQTIQEPAVDTDVSPSEADLHPVQSLNEDTMDDSVVQTPNEREPAGPLTAGSEQLEQPLLQQQSPTDGQTETQSQEQPEAQNKTTEEQDSHQQAEDLSQPMTEQREPFPASAVLQESSEHEQNEQKSDTTSDQPLQESIPDAPEVFLTTIPTSEAALDKSAPEADEAMVLPPKFEEMVHEEESGQSSDADAKESIEHEKTEPENEGHDEADDEDEAEGDETAKPFDLVVTLTDDDITPRPATSAATPTALSPNFGELTPERSRRESSAEGSALPNFESTKESRRASKRLSFAALRLSIGSGLGLSTMSLENRASNSTSGMSIDDELGDEIEEAVVEVAQRLSVSNTPVSAGYPKVLNGFRSTSTPIKSGKAQDLVSNDNWNPAFETAKARSASNHVPQVPREIEITGPVAGKRVGGGIAAKIADLQRNFSRSTSNKSQSSSPTSTTHSTYAQRRAALNSSSEAPPMTPQKHTAVIISNSLANSLETTPSQDEMPRTRSPSSHRSFPPHSMTNGHVHSSGSASRANSRVATPMSESISIRAAMDRQDQSPFASYHKRLPSLPASPEVKSGPTMSFHQRARSAVTNPRQALHPSARSSSVSSLQSSPIIPAEKFDVFGIKRKSSEVSANWRSFGRARGQSDVRGAETGFLPRNTSNSSLDTSASVESSKTDGKKPSRGARLLKRMSSSISSLTAGSRGHLQTLNERVVNNGPVSRLDAVRPKGKVVGDLNVQFPDTLLWKRRWVEIDNLGFLVFKPNSVTENINGVVRRFHMTEFQPPFPPDLDRQELPHSIILDLRDGRTLQCACQSPHAQRQMLHLLLEYHMAWLS